MALGHFSTVSIFTFQNHKTPFLRFQSHHHTFHRNRIFICFAEKERKHGKNFAQSKSNDELRIELKGFLKSAGFPENHVPSMKELSENGRKDLANRVRCRGYKAISELLKNSFKNDCATENTLLEDQEINYACNEETPESSDTSSQSRATSFIQTGNLAVFEDINMAKHREIPKDALNQFGSTIIDIADNNEPQLLADQTDRDQNVLNPRLEIGDGDGHLTSEMAGEFLNQAEIERLKAVLHQKEMELLELKQQVEKEEHSLHILQDKGNKTEKCMEFNESEESLFGLKEVCIDYWGNGESVEVAGSFNGWHNHIRMDMSSEETYPSWSGSSKRWSTNLWLYPGIYEIKFIVDGSWTVDFSREMSTSGSIINNILRVDR